MAQISLIIGIALGAAGAWFLLRARIQQERQAAAEKLALVEDARAKLGDSFKALAGEALNSNNQQFVALAKAELAQHQVQAREDLDKRRQAIETLVKPIGESLSNVDKKIAELERERANAQGALVNHLKTVTAQQEDLKRETANLVTALRAPQTRGRWGEMQLRRVCEMAGMINHCDFCEQQTVASDDGRLRPDVIVQLPGGKQVVVDAKVPLAAYLDAIEARDEDSHALHIQSHVRQMRDHVKKLANKSYWAQFESSPEFVVMFVDESMFRVALDEDPGLLEFAFEQQVLIATPATLLGLLRAVHYGWRQEKVADSAREIAGLGHELHSRLGKFADMLAKVGRSLGSSVNAYNDAVGSFDSRVVVSARKLADAGAASELKELSGPEPIELAPRPVTTAPEPIGQIDDAEPEIRIRKLDAA
ncbi:MAG: DNA recombination protein RmuC [Thermoleophilaceae bacterium]